MSIIHQSAENHQGQKLPNVPRMNMEPLNCGLILENTYVRLYENISTKFL